MALQFTRAFRRLATVPLYRTSTQGVRLASTKPKDPGREASNPAFSLQKTKHIHVLFAVYVKS